MSIQALLSRRILIVDDEPVNVMILEQMLEDSGYLNVRGLTDSTLALTTIEEYGPDLIVLDLMMPVLNGFEITQQLRARTAKDVYLPVLIVTADISQESRRRALKAGATDFLTKPFDQTEVLLRIENLLRTRWQYLLLQDENAKLEYKVWERTQALEYSNASLEQAQAEIVHRLAQAAEFRDDDTGQHTKRVGHTSYLLALNFGLTPGSCEAIGGAAPLHDVGKIGIPDAILLKPGRLTVEEFAIMQNHTLIGNAILSNGHSELVQVAACIAFTHHERWNGSGYPLGLKGNEIPIEGQIVGIADVFDALTHARPYKKAWPVSDAIEEIKGFSNAQFRADLVEAFLKLPHEDLI